MENNPSRIKSEQQVPEELQSHRRRGISGINSPGKYFIQGARGTVITDHRSLVGIEDNEHQQG